MPVPPEQFPGRGAGPDLGQSPVGFLVAPPVGRADVEPGFERYLIQKGSVTLDGVSLTVVDPDGPRFRVALIPETLKVTSFGEAKEGDRFHLEADLVGKWIEKMLSDRGSG